MRGAGTPGREAGPTSKAEFVREVTQRSLDELSQQLEAGNSQQLDAYLRAMGRFHRYSFNNVMLIISQRPGATQVAGFHTWRKLGRAVKKGEKGIAIFAPMKIKPRARADTGGEEDKDRPPQLRFRVVHVFDLEQTEGDPLPEPTRVSGDPRGALSALEAAIVGEGVDLEDVDDLGGAEGCSKGGTIQILRGLEPAARFSVLVHEWAHEILHHKDGETRPPKTVRETEAEAVAFVVSQAVGLETSTASSDYIRIYSGDKETLAQSLDRIQQAACRIIDAVTEEGGAARGQTVEPKLAASGRQR
jgi:hypothetical protein